MNKIGVKILYLISFLALTGSTLAASTTIDEATMEYTVNILGMQAQITEQLYQGLVLFSTVFSTGMLIVLINLYNAANKDTTITQGSLDAKQNQTLSNDICIMNAHIQSIEENGALTRPKKDELILPLKVNVNKSTELAATSVDMSVAPIQTQIDHQKGFFKNLETILLEAQRVGDLTNVKKLRDTISTATKNLASLQKKL